MEHLQTNIEKEPVQNPFIKNYENDQAGNAYLMNLVSVIAGLPLPIINVIASLIFYLSQRRASYHIRWHSLQALLAQVSIIPFNVIAIAWTAHYIDYNKIPGLYFGIYIFIVVLLNITEFIAILITGMQVKKGKDVRWFVISGITDKLCSEQNRDPYAL